MKKPKTPEEYFWQNVEESEKIIHTRSIFDDNTPLEYTSITVFDDRGELLDYVKIIEHKIKKIPNPKYNEELAIYLKQLEAYKQKCAETYKKSQETQRLNAIKKLEKLEKLRAQLQKFQL